MCIWEIFAIDSEDYDDDDLDDMMLIGFSSNIKGKIFFLTPNLSNPLDGVLCVWYLPSWFWPGVETFRQKKVSGMKKVLYIVV